MFYQRAKRTKQTDHGPTEWVMLLWPRVCYESCYYRLPTPLSYHLSYPPLKNSLLSDDICCCNCFVVVNAEIDCNCHRPLPMEITRTSTNTIVSTRLAGQTRRLDGTMSNLHTESAYKFLVIKLKINDNILCAYKYATLKISSR